MTLVHVAANGYTPDAAGYAERNGISHFSLSNLVTNLVNFDRYVDAICKDPSRQAVLKEYQSTTINPEGLPSPHHRAQALDFLESWRSSESNYLILLGDYGVGKSWLLKKYLYELLDRYRADPSNNVLPFLIPLQRFTKAFDFQNLILKTFESYGLSGVHYAAFLYLVQNGRVLLLLDSFDEMAQHLNKMTIRENLISLFQVAADSSKIVMTSRPNYFENKAERILLVDRFSLENLHPVDRVTVESQKLLSDQLEEQLRGSQFGRLNDLTMEQRSKLFKIVLQDNPKALKTLTELLGQFQGLKFLSQRAVIARLLTTVAETLASPEQVQTIDGVPLLPNDLAVLNEAKIFEIIVHNLLHRDQGIGLLAARDRLEFLKRFAVYLQRKGSDFFATPDEVRRVVREVFAKALERTDSPEQDLGSKPNNFC